MIKYLSQPKVKWYNCFIIKNYCLRPWLINKASKKNSIISIINEMEHFKLKQRLDDNDQVIA